MTDITSEQRVRRAYARLAEVDRPEVWITLRDEEDALAAARAVDHLVADGVALPLAGLVAAVKDNIDVAGLPTTAGHPAFAHLPDQDATAVARLQAAGAVVLGKTNLDQFATGLVGTRSPYGAVRGSRDPERISGGSSAGSAVAVALGVVDFALGTDTAGSGRVPAALNGIMGIKTTLGLIPVDGVVPACRSYDCVTVFAPTLALATRVSALLIGPSPLDPGSRAVPADVRLAPSPALRIAVPADEFLATLDAERLALFRDAVDRLAATGAEVATIGFAPFLDCAKLLYEGALVAERYAAYGEFLAAHPDGADPTVAGIAARAADRTGPALVADQDRVARYRGEAAELLEGFDVLLVPTAPAHPTLGEVAADPVRVNSLMGTYTNFLNLLDLAGVAVPAGETTTGSFGMTVVARRFEDQLAVDVAALLVGEEPESLFPASELPLVVVGAHLRGLPLNGDLIRLGARFAGEVATSPDYRMFALPGPIPKPALIRVAEDGASLPGEEWHLSPAALGTFLAALPAPMALGRISLDDGRELTGFGCFAPEGPDITAYGGWRAYLGAKAV